MPRRSPSRTVTRFVSAAALAAWTPLALVVGGCFPARSGSSVLNQPSPAWQIDIPVERQVEQVTRVVAAAGAEMELSVDETPTADRSSWLLSRGPRLETGGLYYRVDLARTATAGTRVRVWSIPKSPRVEATHETIAKPGELAFRIVTLALGSR
ncbi:MAG TPA: hypothetical protein VK601_27535 [Kofleriaceae bacterium]|nr:hypothetical protein [Kofleriaceae bacterium]